MRRQAARRGVIVRDQELLVDGETTVVDPVEVDRARSVFDYPEPRSGKACFHAGLAVAFQGRFRHEGECGVVAEPVWDPSDGARVAPDWPRAAEVCARAAPDAATSSMGPTLASNSWRDTTYSPERSAVRRLPDAIPAAPLT